VDMCRDFYILAELRQQLESNSIICLKIDLIISYNVNNLFLNSLLFLYLICAFFWNYYESTSLFVKEVYFIYLFKNFIHLYCFSLEKSRNINPNQEIEYSIIELIEPHSSFFATV
jgi:hypothetical protein